MNKSINILDKKDYNLSFFIKWINDKPILTNKYGKEYLISLTHPIFSKISKLLEDFKIFPLANQAKLIKIRLNKGDTLFIPAGWWHYVESHNRNIAINNWYIPYHKNVTDIEWRKSIKGDNCSVIDITNINSTIFKEYIIESKPLIIKNSHKLLSKKILNDQNNNISLRCFSLLTDKKLFNIVHKGTLLCKQRFLLK